MFNRYLNQKVRLKADCSYFLNTGVFYLEKDEIGKLCEVSIHCNKTNKIKTYCFSIVLSSDPEHLEFLVSNGTKKLICFLTGSVDMCVKIKFYNL